ncbi:CHAP domain-containing protein [Klebsiella pneumoniae]|nr:CHAP domain-containing protein [Klebsiella pneumoniae]
MGHKWQCVEFAAPLSVPDLWPCLHRCGGWLMKSSPCVSCAKLVNDNILPLRKRFASGSRRPPIAGSLLIWQKGGEFKHAGHVAVIHPACRQ